MMILLGCMDLNLSFRHPKPDKLTDDSAPEDVLYYENWGRSNRMSLMIMKRSVPEVFRSAITNERLISDGILGSLDFTDVNVCVRCFR